ncbi:MAG: type I restriction-modification system subunit M N-terminal domain-containing protein [Burkholderiales bacterium]|nr:type I restriction-modification system subunit M N-terminal domain-containing protein [Opitutaceae bacterium]
MPTINQDEINNVAWRACDTFRGTLDPSDYKNYILVTLFLKYISDVIKDHRAAYLIEYKGDEARVTRRLARERFLLPPGADFDSLYARRNDADIGQQINIALEHIEDRRHPRHVGRGARETRLPHRRQSPPQTGPHAATPHRRIAAEKLQ